MYQNLFSNHIDAVLVQSPVNRFYFTGYSASNGYLTLTENAKTFYTDPRYYEEAQKSLAGFTVKCVGADALAVVVQDLLKAGVKTLGYEDDYLTVAAFKNFKKETGALNLQPASDAIAAMRLVKTPEEIAHITAAQRLSEKAFEKVTDALRAGITEKELKTQLVVEALRLGAEDTAFDPIVAFGENTAIPHHRPTDRRLEKSDLILIDFGVKLNGWCSDMTRTFCLTEPDEKIARLHEIVLEAQDYALKHIKAGMTCREADSLAREYIRANGYDTEFSHSLGHGVGLEIHEAPRLSENSQELLLPGMVVTVEPGVYISGFAGVRIEDMIVVRENGAENLTKTPKEPVL